MGFGAQLLQGHGRGMRDAQKEQVLQLLKTKLRPELINRLDEVAVFHGLEKQDMLAIVEQQVAALQKRLEDKDVSLVCEPSAAELIVEEAFDAEYGARPVRRYVESEVVTEVSKLLIANEMPKGSVLKIGASAHGGKRKLAYSVQSV